MENEQIQIIKKKFEETGLLNKEDLQILFNAIHTLDEVLKRNNEYIKFLKKDNIEMKNLLIHYRIILNSNFGIKREDYKTTITPEELAEAFEKHIPNIE